MKLTNDQLKGLGQLLDPTGIIKQTRDELLSAFKKIVELITKKEQKLEKTLSEMQKEFNALTNKINSEHQTLKGKTERIVEAELESLLRRFSAEVKKVDSKIAEVRDGKDADEEQIVDTVLARIVMPESTILDGPEQLRDKLETLTGKDRLDVSAIDGLDEKLEEIKTMRVGGRGGAPVHKFIDDETPVGTVNGVNTDFTLAKSPMGLQIFVNGQRMTVTTDYTISNRTITFLTAPPTGSIIRADYRHV